MTDKTTDELTDGEEDQNQTADPLAGYSNGKKRPLDHGVKIRGKVKRGEDTRDQDELLIEGRGEDAEEAAADFEAALAKAEENKWADRLRALQPEPADEEGED